MDPGFLSYDEAGLPSSFHFALSAPLIDAGDPSLLDVDGSRSDPGIYGGPEGDGWDLDLEGYPDWFWPGTLDAAPEGFQPSDCDRDDLDASSH